MNKILSMLALSTIASTSTPIFSQLVLNTSVNKGSIRVVEPILKKIDTNLGRVIKFNEHLAVSINDNNGEKNKKYLLLMIKEKLQKLSKVVIQVFIIIINFLFIHKLFYYFKKYF